MNKKCIIGVELSKYKCPVKSTSLVVADRSQPDGTQRRVYAKAEGKTTAVGEAGMFV